MTRCTSNCERQHFHGFDGYADRFSCLATLRFHVQHGIFKFGGVVSGQGEQDVQDRLAKRFRLPVADSFDFA